VTDENSQVNPFIEGGVGRGGRAAHPTPGWQRRAHRAAGWSALVGVVILGSALLIAWSWRGELPEQVGSHWTSMDQPPDTTQSLGGFLGVMAIMGFGTILLFTAMGWFWGREAMMRRLMAAMNVWMGAFLGSLTLLVLGAQRGLDEAAGMDFGNGGLATAILVPFVPAIIAAALVRKDPPMPATDAVPADAERVPLAAGERAVWVERVTGGAGLWVVALAVVLLIAAAVITRMWALLIIGGLVAALFATMFVFVVRVDAAGLHVRSALGFPRTSIPANEVERASVIQVNAFADFGGWGWRVRPGGRVGVVLRSGPGLLVERTGGRSFVVVVDDAAAGAALLNTMADRSEEHRARGSSN
jgi:hypothetical protein